LVVPYSEAGRLGHDKSEPWRDLFPIAVGTTDTKWRIVGISSEVQELLGRSSSDCTGLSLMDLAHPEDLAKVWGDDWRDDGLPVSRCRVRFAHADDYWVEVCILVSKRPADLGFVFALVGEPVPPRPPSLDRTAELELRLRHIGAEVRAARVLDDFSALPAPSDFPPIGELTTRQWEILSRLLQGQRVPTIARELFLTPSTVRNHLAAIFRKFGAHSQPELLALLKPKPPAPDGGRGVGQ
jgi:DNA-binding CsgD family transcriptional regulator